VNEFMAKGNSITEHGLFHDDPFNQSEKMVIGMKLLLFNQLEAWAPDFNDAHLALLILCTLNLYHIKDP